ncbi:MAG: glycosyltransferase family A protein [Verrucomicrobiota bacterium]
MNDNVVKSSASVEVVEKIAGPLFTIFTPAYNRATLLPRVYECLKAQSIRDFEWVIVDDGSTDNTRAVVEAWREEGDIPIHYHWKENGGKHSAVNRGISVARGCYFIVVDSDDWLIPRALEILKCNWEKIADQDNFVGVIGLFSYESGEIVGDRFPHHPFISNSVDLRFRHRLHGDKVGANRTAVLKAYPFPADLSRNYVSESLIWNRIAEKYDTLFINEVIGIKEYQAGGITDNSSLNDWRNPVAGRLHAAELLDNRRGIPLDSRIKAVARLIKCSIYSCKSPFVVRRLTDKLLIPLLSPLALVLIARDLWRLRKLKGRNSGVGPIRPEERLT